MDYKIQQELFNKWRINFNVNEKLTQTCNKKFYLKLKEIFNNVFVVEINDIVERYRIGSNNKEAILGKDFVIIERHSQFFLFMGSLRNARGSTVPYAFVYDFDLRNLYDLTLLKRHEDYIKWKWNFFT